MVWLKEAEANLNEEHGSQAEGSEEFLSNVNFMGEKAEEPRAEGQGDARNHRNETGHACISQFGKVVRVPHDLNIVNGDTQCCVKHPQCIFSF